MDSEQAVKIAEALGLDGAWITTWEKVYDKPFEQYLKGFEGQQRIRNRVRELWIRTDDDEMIVRYRKHMVIVGKTGCVIAHQGSSEPAAWAEALLWLAREE